VIGEIKNGEKEAYVSLEFSLIHSRSKLFVKIEPKLFVRVKGKDRGLSDFENRSDVTETLRKWFRHVRSGNVPVSGPLLMTIFVLPTFSM